jgi:ribosomal protein L31E
METKHTQKSESRVEKFKEARELFLEHQTYCRKHQWKYPKTPIDTIKYYFHWYHWMYYDGRVKKFEDFVEKVFVPDKNAKGRFDFILYLYPIIGKKQKKSDEIRIAVSTLMLAHLQEAKSLLEQNTISDEDIQYFLDTQQVRVRIDDEIKNSDVSQTEKRQETVALSQFCAHVTNTPKTLDSTIRPHSEEILVTLKSIEGGVKSLVESQQKQHVGKDTDVSVSNKINKRVIQKEMFKIPTKLLNALAKNGYIEKGTYPYKWIKLARNKQVCKSALFELLDLLGCFKKKDPAQKVDFINSNFSFDIPVGTNNFNRTKKTEFFKELENLVKTNVS